MRRTTQSRHTCRARASASIFDVGRVEGSGSENSLLITGDVSDVPCRRTVDYTPTWYNRGSKTLLGVNTETTY